jgi:hypothetical protein
MGGPSFAVLTSARPKRSWKGWGVDQTEASLAVPGSRADSEITAFIDRRHTQRESRAEDLFGNVLVEDRSVLDEEWQALRREHERQKQQTRLEEWREFHMRMARNLSRTAAGMVRHHLLEVKRIDGR